MQKSLVKGATVVVLVENLINNNNNVSETKIMFVNALVIGLGVMSALKHRILSPAGIQ